MDKESFGSNMRELRNDKGLSLQQLGDKTGFTKSYISMIENGRLKALPQSETLKKLADGLNIEHEYILYLAGVIDENLYKQRENTRKEIALKRSMIADNTEDLTALEANINKLTNEWENLRNVTTDSVYDEDNHELLEQIKSKTDRLKSMYFGAAKTREELQKEIAAQEHGLAKLNQLIHERETATSESDKDKIQEDINEVTSSFFDLLSNSTPSLNLFNVIDKKGISFQKQLDFPVNDLYFHLTDEHNKKMYKSIILNDNDRKYINSMIEMYLLRKYEIKQFDRDNEIAYTDKEFMDIKDTIKNKNVNDYFKPPKKGDK